jgi:hypothetical protein
MVRQASKLTQVLKDTIGTGGFAKVKLARHRLTEEKVLL